MNSLYVVCGACGGTIGYGTTLEARMSRVPFPSDSTMVLGSTQPQTEISTRCTSWGVEVTGALPLLCTNCLEIWQPQAPGTLVTPTGIALPLYVVRLKLLKIISEAIYPAFVEIKCN